MKPVRYASSDGLEIPAYLTLPKGVVPKNLPAVILPHGGPSGRDVWGYDSYAQFLANRGYAVLQPNFRGSARYGKKFLDAGNKQWGDKMQDDVTWGAKYLVGQGIADAKRIGIMGESYGGYADACGRGVHAGRLRGGRVSCRAVEPDHVSRLDPAILGVGPEGLVRGGGRSDHAGGEGAARAAVAAQLGRQDPRRRSSSSRARMTRASTRPSPTRSSWRSGTAGSRWSTRSRPTKGTASCGP